MRAHFDLRDTHLSCQAIWMCIDQGPSWRQRGRPQPVNQAQNFSEQSSGDSDFRELKGDITAMSHDLRADLDELLPKCRQRPVFDLLRQREGAQEVAEIIGECMELEPDLVVAETVAR